MNPPVDGRLVSSTGFRVSIGDNGPTTNALGLDFGASANATGIGLLVALLFVAYWWHRIL